MFTALKVPRYFPFVLLVKVGLKQKGVLGTEEVSVKVLLGVCSTVAWLSFACGG